MAIPQGQNYANLAPCNTKVSVILEVYREAELQLTPKINKHEGST